jgi:tetratricopeptide (TPR) repeat protein
MKKRFLIILGFIYLSFNLLHCQDMDKGKWYFGEKQYESAGKIFRTLLEKNPSNAEALYYLGQVLYNTGKEDSAEVFYRKGTIADPKYPFNYIGLGKIQLDKSNRPEWFKNYDKGRKLSADLFGYNLEAGEACLSTRTQNFDLSENYLEEAQKANAKDCRLLICLGDLYLKSKSPGDAVNEYERALYYDKSYTKANLRLGEIYAKASNFRDAITNFNKAIALDTSQILAYKERGDLYYTFAKYDEAKADYDIYMQRSDNTADDKERYAFILFFSKNYKQAKELLNEAIQANPENTVMYRIAAYIDYENEDYLSGQHNIEYFFAHHDTSKFISLDYAYYGHLLIKNGQDSAGTIQLETALKMDSTKTDLYEEIGKSYSKQKKYLKAIETYEKMIPLNSTNLSNIYYQIGRNYYFMAEDSLVVSDSIVKAELYHKADSCFEIMNIHSPESYVGFIWRGRALSKLDPEATAGLAKPAYEKAMTLLEAGDISKTPKLVIECYRYLAFYHYVLADKLLLTAPKEADAEMTNSINYWTKILNLDPSDQQARTALQNLQKM